jgi:hypothetical protein
MAVFSVVVAVIVVIVFLMTMMVVMPAVMMPLFPKHEEPPPAMRSLVHWFARSLKRIMHNEKTSGSLSHFQLLRITHYVSRGNGK